MEAVSFFLLCHVYTASKVMRKDGVVEAAPHSKGEDKAPHYSGRLELTWTNKDQRLLAHEDGSYEWVPPGDYRVAEVRLLHDAGEVGEVHAERRRAKDNLLIRGDALGALRSLIELPEFEREYAGKVRLAYLDPPFNTQQSFLDYDDALEHSVWLTMMRDRLEQIKKLLAPHGSVWVHCDDSEQHRLRSVLDEVFGAKSFKATIVWEKLYARKSNTDFSTNHDLIHVYARDPAMFTRNLQPPSEEQRGRFKNPDNDPRGPWQSVSFHVRTDDPAKRTDYRYKIELPSGRKVGPPRGRHWNGKRDRYERLLADDLLYFGEDGDSLPRFKDFRDPADLGLVPMTTWPRTEVGDNDESKSEIQELFPEVDDPFQTPKPERLMERIIGIGSEPGEVVLDCFLGSGTTAAVAHKLNRRWIGIERDQATIEAYALPRLTRVVEGQDPGGISEVADWSGGGGFRILDVGPSMFADDEGIVVLADWAAKKKLGEATAAQLGYEYEDDPPFCGRKGRSRLAVIDGLLSGEVADLLLRALPEDQRMTVCATALDPEAADQVRQGRPGCRARKIPASILTQYQREARWRPVEPQAGNGEVPSVAKPTKAK